MKINFKSLRRQRTPPLTSQCSLRHFPKCLWRTWWVYSKVGLRWKLCAQTGPLFLEASLNQELPFKFHYCLSSKIWLRSSPLSRWLLQQAFWRTSILSTSHLVESSSSRVSHFLRKRNFHQSFCKHLVSNNDFLTTHFNLPILCGATKCTNPAENRIRQTGSAIHAKNCKLGFSVRSL